LFLLSISQAYPYRFYRVLRVRVGSQTNEKGDGGDGRGCLRRAAWSRSLITASERRWCAQWVAARKERGCGVRR